MTELLCWRGLSSSVSMDYLTQKEIPRVESYPTLRARFVHGF